MQTFNTLIQLMAMQRDGYAALAGAEKLLFTPDLFNYFLTGEAFNEATLVSTTQLAEPSGNKWCGGLLKETGVNKKLLQKIIPPSQRIGKITETLQAEISAPYRPYVYSTASHDTAAAVASVPADDKDFLYISSGTWSLLGTVLDAPILTEDAFKRGYTNEGAADGKIRFLKNIMGLWIIQEWKRDYELSGKQTTFADIEDMARESKPFKCLINPNDETFYSPLDMNGKIVRFCERTGQRPPQDMGEAGRCVAESLAFAYRAAVEDLESITGKKYSKMYIVGGGSKDRLLNQFTANAIGRPVIAGIPEATSTGNIICQAKGLGLISSLDEGRKIARESFPLFEYLPQDTAAWDDNYGRYLGLSKRH
jgi:sugar (pentulose or hexulose) kinase